MKNSVRIIAFISLFVMITYSCKKEPTTPTYPGWTNYNTHNSGLSSDYLQSIAIDEQGNKWFGGQDDGIIKFDGVHWITYSFGYFFDDVNAIAVDKHDSVWFSCNAGLMEYNGTTWTHYSTFNSGIPSNTPGSISFDKQGIMWVSCNGV